MLMQLINGFLTTKLYFLTTEEQKLARQNVGFYKLQQDGWTVAGDGNSSTELRGKEGNYNDERRMKEWE